MKNISFGLSVLRPVRFLIVVFTCALLIFSNAFPAAAIGTKQSSPQKATDQLLETQKETDKATAKPPLGLEETTRKANEGLNEVQGAADLNKMNRPENSQSAVSAEDKVESFLEKITGNK
ncbi:MAG: hypothetical protein KME49_08140 [Brasilonema octagenarum HA4186-MV1]|jgi:hypothetical protein|uniref:Low temperature-induced protein n=1 Tax=Brasilonema octagenarum UFV-OR1 TaxID=417115 RepID=A0ABX1M8C8_9CYAN|nr:hypothetical protein [Brasilonema octagenarum]MBW4625460.1 hypothetical protein [Brasilonema octagenarum HA4186-MV1]NMF63084.1 hypothetical protein [Brasilonema octagenarum UFV-OR1]